jgi:hypothetical protein
MFAKNHLILLDWCIKNTKNLDGFLLSSQTGRSGFDTLLEKDPRDLRYAIKQTFDSMRRVLVVWVV